MTLPSYNGELIASKGEICDKNGRFVSSPQPQEANRHTDWGPYRNRLRFEVADLLFRCVQMSGSHIDEIL